MVFQSDCIAALIIFATICVVVYCPTCKDFPFGGVRFVSVDSVCAAVVGVFVNVSLFGNISAIRHILDFVCVDFTIHVPSVLAILIRIVGCITGNMQIPIINRNILPAEILILHISAIA